MLNFGHKIHMSDRKINSINLESQHRKLNNMEKNINKENLNDTAGINSSERNNDKNNNNEQNNENTKHLEEMNAFFNNNNNSNNRK